MSFSTLFFAIVLALASLHMVTSTRSPGAGPGSTTANSIEEQTNREKNIVKAGVSRGLEECQRLFKDQVWDCSFYNKSVNGELPDFVQRTLPYANKETALLHAITAAGIFQEIISQCDANKIIDCSCDKKGRRSPGCKDKLSFAERTTLRLLTVRRPWNDERRKIDTDNQQVGIKVFKKSYNRNCPRARKNCNTFQDVANELKNKYDSAINKTNKPLSAGVFQRNTMQVLTYRDPSPDYCVRNVTAGSPGLKERVCGNSGRKTRQCRSLCRRCGLKLKRVNCTNCSVKNTVTVCKQKNPKH